jgi:hypothetical protein
VKPPAHVVAIERVVVRGLAIEPGAGGALRALLVSELARRLEGDPQPFGLADAARLRVTTTPPSSGITAAARAIADGVARALRGGGAP